MKTKQFYEWLVSNILYPFSHISYYIDDGDDRTTGGNSNGGAVGGGGIGDLAISYGYQRFDSFIMIVTVIV